MEPTDLRNHIDSGVLWRGALVLREKMVRALDQEYLEKILMNL